MKRDPKGWKYKRSFKFKNKITSFEPAMSQLGCLTYGVVVEKDVFLEYKHLFTIYKFLRKKLKKKINFKINVSCILPFTKKPVSARMGKGKGAWRGFNVFLRRGTFLFEVHLLNSVKSILVLNEVLKKLPVKSRIVKLKI